MRFVVANSFIDRYTKEYYPAGSIYETKDESRAEELKNGGFLGEEVEQTRGRSKASDEDQRPAASVNTSA
jgi:hypothetical protein